jgi:hypothetical protein
MNRNGAGCVAGSPYVPHVCGDEPIILPLHSPDVVRQSVTPAAPAKRRSARGKYAHVATSSDAFAARKAEKIGLE